jgi:hypothetical protein
MLTFGASALTSGALEFTSGSFILLDSKRPVLEVIDGYSVVGSGSGVAEVVVGVADGVVVIVVSDVEEVVAKLSSSSSSAMLDAGMT